MSTTATARCWSRRAIAGGQFAEWITGRNPGTYVAVHYIKLIDFTFGGRLQERRIAPASAARRAGRRPDLGFDAVATDLCIFADGREAAFDIHTSWVTPDNFPGYVEQEVQFRFDNGVWNGHSRKRGVECTIEGSTPLARKITLNNHYNGTFLEPWNERSPARLRRRGAGAVCPRGGDGRIRRTGRRARRPAGSRRGPGL